MDVAAGPTQSDLRRRLLWITAFRIAAVSALVGTTAVLAFQGGEPLGGRVAASLSVLAIVTNLLQIGVASLLRLGRGLRALAAVQIVGDVGFAAFFVYLTGGADSLFSFMFLLAIVSGGILLSVQGAWVAAVLSFLADAFVIVGLQRQWIPLIDPSLEPTRLGWDVIAQILFTHGSAFALTAVLATYVASQMRKAGARADIAESSLSRLHVLHEAIVRSVATGIATADEEGRISFLNRAGEEILDTKASLLRGLQLETVFPTVIREAEKTGGRAERLECAWDSPGRPSRQLGFTVTPLIDEGGGQLGSITVFQDLTDVRDLERRAARSERLAAIGQLAAGLAHELRNPLASMSGSIELLSKQAEPQNPLHAIVLRESERLNRLVSDFLSFAGPATPRFDAVDLQVLIEEVDLVFGGDPSAGGVRRELRLSPAVAMGDDEQLRQVLWNLMRNAVEASAPGGRIEVSAGEGPLSGTVFLSVRDWGAGIAQQDLERIFDPFFTTRDRGTGLGLSTVLRIVDGLGGQLEVESVVGNGSCFTISLPALTLPGRIAAEG